MADKKKMSVADILAAARADKQSTPGSEKPAAEEVPSADSSPVELGGSETAPEPVAAKSGSSERPSVKDILAMAR